MKCFKVFYSACLVFLICSCGVNKKQAYSKVVHVVLLGGQSNMAGHGDYDKLGETIKQRIEKISHRVLLSTSENTDVKPRPLSFYISHANDKYKFNKHFGPELFIGLTLAEANPNQEYLLIKKAVGGTSLYGAWNANWSTEKAEVAERGNVRKQMQLFNSHKVNIDNQLKRLKALEKEYKIIGMTWMQGESDTKNNLAAKNYGENLEDLISGYRKHLNIDKMPFIIGQINVLPREYKKGPELVRLAMQSVANSDDQVDIINTSIDDDWNDFPKHSDNLHYNVEGQKRLGISFAEKLIKLNK